MAATPTQVTSSSFRKEALLQALAEELKREKLRASSAAEKMLAVEQQVEQKHAEFLHEEERLSAERDANAAIIASLRKELATRRRELEAASHVDEDEAAAFMALLSSRDGANGSQSPSNGVFPSGVPASPAAGNGRVSHDSPMRSPPLDSGHSSGDDIERPPPVHPTSLVSGHPFQTSSPYPPSGVPDAHLPPSSPPHAAFEYSVWQDSLGDEPAGQVHPELAKNGGRWSKVFPGLKRRSSSTKRV
ncbi:hypothetical protein JCM8547_005174 [Rhodosporidiobolus lusitaniae]